MSADMYLVPADPAARPASFDAYPGFYTDRRDLLERALVETPRAVLGDLVHVSTAGDGFSWTTPGFQVQIVCTPSNGGLLVLGAALHVSGDSDEETRQLEGIYESLMQVADTVHAVWWAEEFGGAMARSDLANFVDASAS